MSRSTQAGAAPGPGVHLALVRLPTWAPRGRRLRLAVCAAGAALVLAACGTAEGGDAISASGYEYTLPDGWVAADAEEVAKELGFPPESLDSVALADTASPFPPFAGVSITPAPPGVTTRSYARSVVRRLRGAVRTGAPGTAPAGLFGDRIDVAGPPRPTELGGESAMRVELAGTFSAVSYEAHRLIVLRGANAYSISLIASEGAYDYYRSAFGEILDSWRWSDPGELALAAL